MAKFRVPVLASLAAFAATPAPAADLVEPPTAPDVVATDVLLWSGTYAGIYGSWSFLTVDPSVDNAHGLGAGIYAGYNRQFRTNWVAGIEGTAGVSDAGGSGGGLSVEQDWEASLRGRMGYAFENSLVYGLAGIAGSRFSAADATGSDAKVHLGWQIGAGLETFLTENVTARIEYDFTDYGARDHALGAGTTGIDVSGHAVKLGLGLKF
jgi:outer membrane immunogenic protein